MKLPPGIMPTHHCFDDALEFLVIAGRSLYPTREASFRLVHAIALAPAGPKKGERFAHAWVEETEANGAVVCWESGMLNGELIYFARSKKETYARLRPVTMTKYSVAEALAENRRTNMFGPWQPEYIALCAAPGERPVLFMDAPAP